MSRHRTGTRPGPSQAQNTSVARSYLPSIYFFLGILSCCQSSRPSELRADKDEVVCDTYLFTKFCSKRKWRVPATFDVFAANARHVYVYSLVGPKHSIYLVHRTSPYRSIPHHTVTTSNLDPDPFVLTTIALLSFGFPLIAISMSFQAIYLAAANT